MLPQAGQTLTLFLPDAIADLTGLAEADDAGHVEGART